ncbi:MAG: transposase [Firmicutes bacterium]|nr:transposase [Bacillota bacterium]
MANYTDVMQTAETIESLRQRCEVLEQQNAELTAKLRWFEEQFHLARHRQFGASSERTVLGEQPLLFNEAEAEVAQAPATPEPTLETITYRRRKARSRREALLQNLPVETLHHRLPEAEQICPVCGGPFLEERRQFAPLVETVLDRLPKGAFGRVQAAWHSEASMKLMAPARRVPDGRPGASASVTSASSRSSANRRLQIPALLAPYFTRLPAWADGEKRFEAR